MADTTVVRVEVVRVPPPPPVPAPVPGPLPFREPVEVGATVVVGDASWGKATAWTVVRRVAAQSMLLNETATIFFEVSFWFGVGIEFFWSGGGKKEEGVFEFLRSGSHVKFTRVCIPGWLLNPLVFGILVTRAQSRTPTRAQIMHRAQSLLT